MKWLSVFLLSLLSMSISATNDRFHVCQSKDAFLRFAESSFLDEPVITLDYKTSSSWSGADIEINSLANNLNKITALSDSQPLSLSFTTQAPLDPAQEFHSYEMSVQILDFEANISLVMPMKCSSQKINLWPLDLSRL